MTTALSQIAICIRDGYVPDEQACSDPYVFAMRSDPFIDLRHYQDARVRAAEVDMSVHCLEDWVEVTHRHIQRAISWKRVVCLKSGLAYARSLRYEKVSRSDAEREFLRLFEDRHLPDWRPSIRLGPAFDNYMQHQICAIANDMKLVYQIHTGIHEGNGNNVFIDMCWGHIISPEASRRALVEWLDAVPANKINAFGGDYAFVDGVYGHQYIARRNVAASLATKVDDGSMSLTLATEIATWLFVENPKRLFGLDL